MLEVMHVKVSTMQKLRELYDLTDEKLKGVKV